MKSDCQCVHKVQRSRCVQCGGYGLCTHGRQRSRCSECGGKGVCKHARRKEDCKECSAKPCVHLRRRYSCIDCGGAGTCKHKANRSTCKRCGGGGICEHGRRCCRCKQCTVPAKKQTTPKRSHSDRSNAVVSLVTSIAYYVRRRKRHTSHVCGLEGCYTCSRIRETRRFD